MERMSKIAKGLDTFLHIVYTVGIVAGCILLVAMAIIPFAGGSIVQEAATIITLGSVDFNVLDAYIPDQTALLIRVELGLLYTILVQVLQCYCIHTMRGVLRPMVEQQPFGTRVSKVLRRLSFVALIGGAVVSLADLVVEYAKAAFYDFETLFLNDKIIDVELNYVLDTNFILAFAVLYLLSFVFRYGEELQQQADETL